MMYLVRAISNIVFRWMYGKNIRSCNVITIPIRIRSRRRADSLYSEFVYENVGPTLVLQLLFPARRFLFK